MSSVDLQPVHALEVPTRAVSLLVPSACVAEVVSPTALVSVPLSPEWVVGVMGWRLRPVPVISIEHLMGRGSSASGMERADARLEARRRNAGKIVVFYPLPGRKPWEFFGIIAAAEPQSRVVDSNALAESVDVPGNIYIASALRLGDSILSIPDMDALSAAFYP